MVMWRVSGEERCADQAKYEVTTKGLPASWLLASCHASFLLEFSLKNWRGESVAYDACGMACGAKLPPRERRAKDKKRGATSFL